MSNHDDFWTTLAAGHTNTVLAGSMDTHLSGKSIEESFGSVRTLTDMHRAANALVLPVEAGTKVVFAGNLGAHMSYDDAPADGITGEVVTVRSATGEITHHDGKVFVKWADSKFRPIHAEHLRLAGRVASDLKADFEKIKALAEKRPDSKFLKSLLKQMADKGFAPTDKQMAVVKKIEGEAKEMATMQKELKSLSKAAAKSEHYALTDVRANDVDKVRIALEAAGYKVRPYQHKFSGHYVAMVEVEGDAKGIAKVMFPWVREGDAQRVSEKDHFKSLKKGAAHLVADYDPSQIGQKKGGPVTHDPEDKNIMGHFGQGDLHEMTEVATDKTAMFRVASLGDLTDFLKVSNGALVHKSTKDLWSYSKDADGNFLVSRLFDDEGEPLKV